MIFKFIESYENIFPYVDGPFNNPEDELDFDADRFDEEYEYVRNGLRVAVEKFRKKLDLPNDLVSIGHRTGPSRGIGLVVEEEMSANLIFLVEKIQNYLDQLVVEYCVPINLVIDEHGDFKDLYIAVTGGDEILLHADQASWFREIGIPL